MIRAFIALAVPGEALDRCRGIQDRLLELKLDGRFVRVERVHLTLKFLGNVHEGDLPAVEEALRECADPIPPFELGVSGVGAFPHASSARVVWVGVRFGEELRRLQRRIEDRFQKLGFEREERPFAPHLTLARLRSRKNLDRLTRFLDGDGKEAGAGAFRVEEVHLYQSILKPQGADYRRLLSVPLAGPPSGESR